MNPTVDSAGQSFRPRLALGIPGDLLTRLLLVTAHGNGKPNLSTPQATFQLSMTMSVSLEKHVRVQWWYERYSKKVIYRRLRRIHLKIGRTVYITMLTSRRNGRTVYH